jgi:hypothetical protein
VIFKANTIEVDQDSLRHYFAGIPPELMSETCLQTPSGYLFNSKVLICSGKTCITIRYGAKPLELQVGLNAVETSGIEMVITTLQVIKTAVEVGAWTRDRGIDQQVVQGRRSRSNQTSNSWTQKIRTLVKA